MPTLLKNILILGGTHGVEPQSEYVARKLAEHFKLKKIYNAKYENVFDLFQGEVEGKQITIIPDLNRDGLKNNTRGNSRGVDLNRNMPAYNWSSNYSDKAYYPGTEPASELETKALVDLIKNNNFEFFISIHTNHYVRHQNPPQVNFDGPQDTVGHIEAEVLAEFLELPLTHDIGYSTPGSLGSYAKDLQIPCVTLELDDKFSNEGSWAKYSNPLIRFLSRIATIKEC
jgi:murein peptide amidase A